MIVLCAWCEQAGRRTVPGGIKPWDQAPASHGICEGHERALLLELAALTNKSQSRTRPHQTQDPAAGCSYGRYERPLDVSDVGAFKGPR